MTATIHIRHLVSSFFVSKNNELFFWKSLSALTFSK
nr:MAG TPA: Somatostatin/Cortistatin family [Caudoviricetes sp.]